MADNVDITAGTGTTIAADEVGGAKYQRVKIVWGQDGNANDTDTGQAKSLPVHLRSDLGVPVVVVEDAAALSDPIGPIIMGVRRDTLSASEVSAENDVIAAKMTSKGQLHVLAEITSTQVDSVAHDAADAGSPAKIGGRASPTAPAAVSDTGDRVNAWFTPVGALATTPVPHTHSGLSVFKTVDLQQAESMVKATPGQVYGMWVTNAATSTRYIHFYDDTGPSVGVDVTKITIGIPGNSSDDVTGLFGGTHGIAFATAITVAATTADTGTGAPTAKDVICNVFYK
jgi:hypothetical protein